MEKTKKTKTGKEMKVYEVDAENFILALAKKLKEIPEFKMPDWSTFAKTSAGKERPPTDSDWWFIRAASILRKLYMKSKGVTRLRAEYTTKKNRGAKPERVYKSGGKIIRVILQQAEKAGLVEKSPEKRIGRVLSRKGRAFLNEIASSLNTQEPKENIQQTQKPTEKPKEKPKENSKEKPTQKPAEQPAEKRN